MPNSKKITVIMLGFLAGILFLELFLRIVGTIYVHQAHRGSPAQREPGAFVVLCVGDSFTKGQGAPKGKTYPSQLEEFLRAQCPGKRVQVINVGRGAINTAMILKDYERWLDSTSPDAVVLLAGGANLWNAYGYRDFLNKDSWRRRAGDFLYEIKVFKLAKLFLYELGKERTLRAERFVLNGKKIKPEAIRWFRKGIASEREGHYAEAIRNLQRALEEDPLFDRASSFLGWVYFEAGEISSARKIYRELIHRDPSNYIYMAALAARHIRNGQTPEEKEDIKLLETYAKTDPAVRDILSFAKDRVRYWKKVDAWIFHDLSEMIRLARKRGVRVFLQDYPDHNDEPSPGSYRKVNETLREVARQSGTPLVDNERIFDELFLGGERKEDYYAFDKLHCNEKGYQLMAKNVYDVIKEQNGVPLC